MMSVYILVNDILVRTETLSAAAMWVDLLEPTAEEEEALETMLGIDVPTREEMQEIEASSRMYREGDALFLTAPVLTASDTPRPHNTPVTFILTRACTVTVRYATPQPFVTFVARATRTRGLCTTADSVLTGVVETVIDRLADVLERIANELDSVSHDIFGSPGINGHPGDQQPADFNATLRKIGRNGDLNSKARDSLLGINRIVAFLSTEMTRKDSRGRIKVMTRDVRSLSEHAAFLSGKINFLLDATLGMINIEQNNTIKIFSIVAVMALPPTLIASLYGMNFEFMPELSWRYGYAFAWMLMILSALVPYLWIRRKGWL
ncbi:MAG: magnesium transporter CorA family protein [Alphaproteobacteria bacterium]|nr:magnesium transporter CorA family protein [Alphaproteobacteria bacterium]